MNYDSSVKKSPGNVSFTEFLADIVKHMEKVVTKYDLEFYHVNIQTVL